MERETPPLLLIRDPPPFFARPQNGPEGGTFDPQISQGTPPYDHGEGVPPFITTRGTPDPLSPDSSVEMQLLKQEWAKGVPLMIGSRGSGLFFARP